MPRIVFTFRCNENTTIREKDQCVPPKACFPGLCSNGGTCFVVNGAVGCICPAGWGGTFCSVGGPVVGSINNDSRNYNLVAAIVVPIIVGLLLLRKKS